MPLDDPWDFEEVYGALHEVARSVELPEEEQLLVHITTGTHVAQICLFLLVEAGFLPGKLLQTRPRRGKETRGGIDVIDLDLGRYDRIATRFEQERQQATGLLKQGIDTKNAAFNALIDRIERVAAATTAPVLLTGPTGAARRDSPSASPSSSASGGRSRAPSWR